VCLATKDYQVPVLIVSEGEAVAASLIENREREDMSIADESVAFRLLAEEGKSIAHVSKCSGQRTCSALGRSSISMTMVS
jgi:ParB-like chromosome segregation protein Spo0J